MAHNGPYDPPMEAGNSAGSNDRTQRLQDEINQAQNTMKSNIGKISDRGERLDTLQNKSDGLATSANRFRVGANSVRKQMWWKDMKMRMCIIVGVIVLLLIIIIPSVIASKKN